MRSFRSVANEKGKIGVIGEELRELSEERLAYRLIRGTFQENKKLKLLK